MFKKSPIDEPTNAALATARNVIAEREKTARLIDETHAAIERSQDQLQAALARLGEEEATAALAEGEAASSIDRGAQREVSEIKLRIEALEARARGLENRLHVSEDSLLHAEDDLAAARAAWRKVRVADFVEEYEQAVKVLAGVLHRGLALAAAVGATMLGQRLRSVDLPDLQPDSSDSKQALKLVLRRNDGGKMTEYPAWRDVSEALAVFDSHIGPRQLAETLERLTRGIHERKTQDAQHEAERQAQTQPPPADYVRPAEPEPDVDLVPQGSTSGPFIRQHHSTKI